MIFLKFSPLFLLSLLISSAAYAGEMALPKADPLPGQIEVIGAEIHQRNEATSAGIAIPKETASYYAVAPLAQTPTPEEPTAGDENLAFCHSAKWSASCLTGLIIYRCGQYTFPLTPYGCMATAIGFVAALELKRIDVVVEGATYSLPVILTAQLERLIQSSKIQADLVKLRAELVYAARNKTAFDLWNWSLSAAGGNHEKTLRNLAVLLQDTTGIAVQIQYLKGITKDRGFSAATIQAIDDLDEINYQLSYDVLKQGDWKSWLRLYPQTKNIEKEATPLIYHFYPMAYLALRLKNAGFGTRLSTFIPFLFNTEYNSQTLDPMMWPMKHPRPFKIDSGSKRWNMRDNYAGLAGSLWGIKKTSSLTGLEKYQNAYSKDPFKAMRHYFWSMPNPE